MFHGSSEAPESTIHVELFSTHRHTVSHTHQKEMDGKPQLEPWQQASLITKALCGCHCAGVSLQETAAKGNYQWSDHATNLVHSRDDGSQLQAKHRDPAMRCFFCPQLWGGGKQRQKEKQHNIYVPKCCVFMGCYGLTLLFIWDCSTLAPKTDHRFLTY